MHRNVEAAFVFFEEITNIDIILERDDSDTHALKKVQLWQKRNLNQEGITRAHDPAVMRTFFQLCHCQCVKVVHCSLIGMILQPGGELFFSDMYANADVPEEFKKDEEAWG